MRIGITGQIGTGKSEVAAAFAGYGACVISADQIGKEVVESNRAILNKLARTFGRDILTNRGLLRRKLLGIRAFSSPENTRKLNGIVHPVLLKKLDLKVRQAERKYAIVVIDAALLIDWGWEKRVDLTILVNAGREIKLKRLQNKGYRRNEALKRLKSQRPYSELRRKSDLVILNNKDKKYLQYRVARILQKISLK